MHLKSRKEKSKLLLPKKKADAKGTEMDPTVGEVTKDKQAVPVEDEKPTDNSSTN